jgi:hypothetical protein
MLVLKKCLRFASREELDDLRFFLHATEKGHKNLTRVVMASEDFSDAGLCGTLLCEHQGDDLDSDIRREGARDAGVTRGSSGSSPSSLTSGTC